MKEEEEPRYFESRLSVDELEQEQTKKVNLDRSKSRFSKRKEKPQLFEEKAAKINESNQNYLFEAFELGKEYKEILFNKTISANKTFIEESREQEVLGKIIDFARRANHDESEIEGSGSVTIIVLLLKCLLQLGDKYNDVEYKYHILEKNHVKLEKKFNLLSSEKSKDESK